MILDGLLAFDNAVALTTTRASTNILDMLNSRDMGIGDDPALKLAISVPVALTGGTSLTIVVEAAPDNGAGSPGSYVALATSRAYLEAELVAGARLFPIDLPSAFPDYAGDVDAVPRFYRLTYTVDGAFGAGSISAFLVLDNQLAPAYPAGINIAN